MPFGGDCITRGSRDDGLWERRNQGIDATVTNKICKQQKITLGEHKDMKYYEPLEVTSMIGCDSSQIS